MDTRLLRMGKVYLDFGLEDLFSIVVFNNFSNHVPYHNLNHLLVVAENCFEATMYHDLAHEDVRELLAAALLHDVNHTAGLSNDDVNIRNAISFARSWLPRLLQPVNFEPVEQLISITEYPFKRNPETLKESIIRDADLMMITEPNWFELVVLMLRKEMSLRNPITIEDAIKREIDFIGNAFLYSEWGREKFDKYRLPVAKKLESYL